MKKKNKKVWDLYFSDGYMVLTSIPLALLPYAIIAILMFSHFEIDSGHLKEEGFLDEQYY